MAPGTKPAKLTKWRQIQHNLVLARYGTGAHTKHRIQYHLVWILKYRKRVLRGKIAIRLMKMLYEACRMNNWWISEIAIQEDHLHIEVQVPPKDSVAEVVHIFKGGTSRVLRKEYPELEEFLWDERFWADGYFAETVSQVNEEIVKKYIRDQRKNP